MKSIDRKFRAETTDVLIPLRVAFYARVSTEDQADKQTIESQLDYLRRKYAPDFDANAIDPMVFAGEYRDEGYSGTLALQDRPEGKRLLEAVRAGEVDMVVVYRLDRLGRKAAVLLEAHEEFDKHGVAIVSATEPFDTRTSLGTFVFQLLGSIAELERKTIRERMIVGRDRVAREGRFINGAIPYGYDLDANDHLVLSTRKVPVLGEDVDEAEVARQIITRVANGDSGAAVARWLNAMGVPATTRYHRTGGAIREHRNGLWRRDRIVEMIHTSTYRGTRVLQHKTGDIEQDVPAIVDDVTWHRAGAALGHVKRQPLHTPVYTYLLRGKLVCGLCDSAMQGNFQKANAKWKKKDRLYYGCIRAPGREQQPGREPCSMSYVNGAELEELVMSELDAFFADPQAALDELREQFYTRQGDIANTEDIVRRLHVRTRENEAAKRDIVELVKRRRLTFQEADKELEDLAAEAAQIRSELEALSNQRALSEALEVQLVDSATMLTAVGQEWQRYRETSDREQLQAVIQKLVIRVVAYPNGQTRRWYVLGSPQKGADSRSIVGSGPIDRPSTVNPELLQIERGTAA